MVERLSLYSAGRKQRLKTSEVQKSVDYVWDKRSMAWCRYHIFRMGGVHGLYQIIEDILTPIMDKIYIKFRVDTEKFSWKFLRMIKTFFLVDIAWVFFRADSVRAAFYILKNSLNISNIGLLLNGGLYQLGLNERNISILFTGIFFLLLYSLMRERKMDVLDWLSSQNVFFRYMVYWGIVTLITFSLDITGQEFIYFQF